MGVLYFDAQDARLHLENGQYVVKKDKQIIAAFPEQQVDGLMVLGNAQLTTQAIAKMLKAKVPVSFLSSGGQLRGHLVSPEHNHVRLRMRQYDHVRDPALRMVLARQFVIGKIVNSKTFVCRRLKDAGHDDAPLRHALNRSLRMANGCYKLKNLLGIEGNAAKLVFDSFPLILAGSAFAWHGRNSRPPKDPVNAMLSFGYTLLANEVQSALAAIGLDVYAGLSHGGAGQTSYGQPALALDVMEEFRVLVDRLTLRLITSGKVLPQGFAPGEQGGCLMDNATRRVFFSAWQALLKQAVLYEQRRLMYRQIIGEQAALLARALLDDHIQYRPFCL